ncbi:MAG: DUF2194 domain-containing protein [Spirochaetia bacterium]
MLMLRKAMLCLLICLIATAGLFAFDVYENRGTEVLALYKSSDNQSADENEIFYHLSVPLQEMGFTVTYWDIDSGIPPVSRLENVRAIVSWFRGGSMDDPEGYITFLDQAFDRNIQYLVFDNFGAYQNRRTGEYIETALVNHALSRLGIRYAGDWTQDPDILSIAEVDEEIAEHGGSQRIDESALYYRFVPIDPGLNIHLSLTREDRDYGASPVITSNRNGCFALSRYIFRVENNELTMLLNLRQLLFNALFPETDQERIGLLADLTTSQAQNTFNYVTGVLRRTQVPFEVFYPEDFPRLRAGHLRRYTTIGIITKDSSAIDPELLSGYLDTGGSVAVLLSGTHNRIAEAIGSGSGGSAEIQNGYTIDPEFIFGNGLTDFKDDEFIWESGSLLPGEDSEVLAYDHEDETPLLWRNSVGTGTVLTWNWDGFETGDYQGLIMETFLRSRPIAAAALPGIGIMFIDDWPLPMFNNEQEEVGTTDTDFYLNSWWPDILRLLEGRQIPFTSFAIFNYNAIVEAPFLMTEFYAGEGLASYRAAQAVINSGHELGLHGYNHLSLTTEESEYNAAPWPGYEAMTQANRAIRNEWSLLFGDETLPYAYVAPNNIISDEGIRAIHDSLPGIGVISLVRASMVGEETTSEFSEHPEYPDIYMIPRSSSGYLFSNEVRNVLVSSIGGPGIVSHFIHPDDVFDNYRSQGNSWRQMKVQFARMLNFIRSQYPFIQWVSIRRAEEVLRFQDNAGVRFYVDEEGFSIRTIPDMQFRVQVNEGQLSRVEGGEIIHSFPRTGGYVVRATSTHLQLILRD